ncbi:spore germination protein [Candidatus Soleaferrea massiliensis]|uniref:spore germination protein n=1 Tax=Candidatus Soleaferrea massiliensis TaxID=1470354 RepID=UPI000693894C|nr:spore germination protein [Candidatus Soleaferrea massiliensis]
MKKSIYSRIKNIISEVKYKEETPPVVDKKPKEPDSPQDAISTSLQDNLAKMAKLYENSNEYFVKHLNIQGTEIAVFILDGMVDKELLARAVLLPLTEQKNVEEPVYDWIIHSGINIVDFETTKKFSELSDKMQSGFTIILVDGKDIGITIGTQGYAKRPVGETSSRNVVRGSQEGFSEVVFQNIPLLRRRLKTPHFKTEMLSVGRTSHTKLCLCYLDDVVSEELLKDVKKRLDRVDLDVVLDTAYLQPYLEKNPLSVFEDVGTTERPDVLAAELSEGRIGLILDGTPFALIVPHLFNENFQSMDDYTHKYFYSTFIRILRYLSFFISTALPGLFVALGALQYQMLPLGLLLQIMQAETQTPLPLLYEALGIYVAYEILREAGMNLPKTMGHAISIVGALVIGQAAVEAGIVGAPTVIVLSITVISSFLTPDLFQTTTILRFAYIILGGTIGLYGVALLTLVVAINMTSINSFGIPYTSPISPFGLKEMRDVIFKAPERKVNSRTMHVQDLPGSELSKSTPQTK